MPKYRLIQALLFAIGFCVGYFLVLFFPVFLFFFLLPVGLPFRGRQEKEGPGRINVLPALIGAGSGAIAAFVMRYLV